MNAPETRHDALSAPARTCRSCPTTFTPKRPWQAFCSKACRQSFHAKGGEVTRREFDELKARVGALEAKAAG